MSKFLIYTGLTIGGVETFSINLAIQLCKNGREVIIIDQNYNLSSKDLYLKYESIGLAVISPENSLSEKYFKNTNFYIVPYYETEYLHKFYNWVVEHQTILPKLIGYIHNDGAYYYDNAFLFEGITRKFICVSNTIKENLTKILSSRDEKVIYQKCPLVFSSNTKFKKNEELNLLFVGRISDDSKGVFQLVELGNFLNDRGTIFKLRIVGDGSDIGQLKEKFNKTGFNHQVEFITDLEGPKEIIPIYEKSDIILILSHFEGGPLVLYEAMECGVIPVGYDVGVLSEVIIPGENGFIFNHSEKELLFKKIFDLSEAPLNKIKVSAKERIRSLGMDLATYMLFFHRTLDSLAEMKASTAIIDVENKYASKKNNFRSWLINILGTGEYKRNHIEDYVFNSGIETKREDELQQQLDSSLKHYSMVYDHMPSLWKKLGSLIRIAAKCRANMGL